MEIEPHAYGEMNYNLNKHGRATINEILIDGIKNILQVIVDVGCGNGDITRMIAREFPSATIVALDILPSMIKYSNYRVDPEDKDRLNFVVQDYCAHFEDWNENLRAVEGKVDLVWSTHSLHYAPVEKRQVVIKNLVRLLKPGGRLHLNFYAARNFVPFLPEELKHVGQNFTIPEFSLQLESWRKRFAAVEQPIRCLEVNGGKREMYFGFGCGDDHVKHYKGGRTFINSFRPFLGKNLSDQEKDHILNMCAEFVFSPNLSVENDQHKFEYDLVQIRGVK